MNTFVLTIHILASVILIVVVLLQAGKGASMGAAFGGGGGQPIFGSSQGSFIGKLTAAVAIIFMLTSLTLAYFSSSISSFSIMKGAETPVQQEKAREGTAEVPAGPAGQ